MFDPWEAGLREGGGLMGRLVAFTFWLPSPSSAVVGSTELGTPPPHLPHRNADSPGAGNAACRPGPIHWEREVGEGQRKIHQPPAP